MLIHLFLWVCALQDGSWTSHGSTGEADFQSRHYAAVGQNSDAIRCHDFSSYWNYTDSPHAVSSKVESMIDCRTSASIQSHPTTPSATFVHRMIAAVVDRIPKPFSLINASSDSEFDHHGGDVIPQIHSVANGKLPRSPIQSINDSAILGEIELTSLNPLQDALHIFLGRIDIFIGSTERIELNSLPRGQENSTLRALLSFYA